jgi:hypothetical protein
VLKGIKNVSLAGCFTFSPVAQTLTISSQPMQIGGASRRDAEIAEKSRIAEAKALNHWGTEDTEKIINHQS